MEILWNKLEQGFKTKRMMGGQSVKARTRYIWKKGSDRLFHGSRDGRVPTGKETTTTSLDEGGKRKM